MTETAEQWRMDEWWVEAAHTGCEFPRLWPPRREPVSDRTVVTVDLHPGAFG